DYFCQVWDTRRDHHIF
nr:immunoglobulin light chain junction region [Macaca mulatta]